LSLVRLIIFIVFIIVFIVTIIAAILKFSCLRHIKDHPKNVGVHLVKQVDSQAAGLPGSDVVLEYQHDSIHQRGNGQAIWKADDGRTINDHMLELLA